MIGVVLIGWFAATLVALVPVLCGRWARGLGTDWWSVHLAVLLLLTAAFALLVALVASAGEAGARHAGAVQGVVTFVVCALPVLAFYSLGLPRAPRPHSSARCGSRRRSRSPATRRSPASP